MKVVATNGAYIWYTCTVVYDHSEEAGVLEKYGPGARVPYISRVSKEASQDNKPVTILAFYFSDPFPLFLVRDHFS